MTRLLYDTLTSTLQLYPRADDEPVIGLDPRYLEMDMLQQPEPSYDPSTHQLQPTEDIDTDARTVTRGWTLVELPPPVPTPDWTTFKTTALGSSSLNSILAAAYQTVPVAAGALAPALLAAEQGNINDFAIAWAAICTAVTVPPEVITGFVSVATSCNLPAAFVAALWPQET